MKKYGRFLLVFLFLFLSSLFLEQTKSLGLKDNYSSMLEAAKRAETAFHAIKEEKLARGYSVSPADDPNQTGMIGEAYTEITTTLGSLEAKRSTTNPNTAAMIVDMLDQCGVKKGDTVAVNLSSSFPCLNISVLCALDALEVNGVIINSLGASTYGATLPDFTYLDMEHFLSVHGLLTNKTSYFSLGGADDIGREMPDEIKKNLISRLSGYGYQFLYYENLDENVSARRSVYKEKETPVCFINAGGNLLSFGSGPEAVSARDGILRPGKRKAAGNGLIPLFLNDGVPVIHLLNMKGLLPSWGLPYDPSPVPAAGEGDVYYTWQYSRPVAVFLLAAGLFLLFWAIRHNPRRKIPL